MQSASRAPPNDELHGLVGGRRRERERRNPDKWGGLLPAGCRSAQDSKPPLGPNRSDVSNGRALPHLVLRSRILPRQRSPSFHVRRRGQGVQEPVWAEVFAKDQRALGPLELYRRDSHRRRSRGAQPLQSLLADRHATRILADDADVWDRNQAVLERG